MRKIDLFAAMALIAGGAVPALAQTDENIVVTATRTPTPVLRLPADVLVIDIDAAQARGINNLADVLSEAPGLAVVRSGGFGQQTSIFSGGANSNHTLVLFDGIRLNDPSSPNSAFDAGQDTLSGLSRIEIVKGPMSAVYGSDAIGGVINMLPRHGRAGALNAELDLSAGSFGAVNGAASVDGTVGRLRYALVAEGASTDGYDITPERFATYAGERDGASSGTATGVFDLEVSNAFAVDVLVRARRSQADFDAFDYPFPTFAETRIEDSDLQLSKNDMELARLGATWRANEALSLRISGGIVGEERAQKDDGAVTSHYDGDRRFADLNLDWRVGDADAFENVALAAGLSAESEAVNLDTGFSTVNDEQDRRGAFLTTQGDIGRFTLTGAARVDDADGFGTHSTWRAGASYAFSDRTRLYAAYGTSFRAPTLSERFTPFYGNPDLEPEEAKGWEIGADAQLAAFGREDGLTLGLVYRDLDVDNLIAGAAPSFVNANIAKADIESAEARASVRLLSWLTARFSYVHTQAEDGVTGAPLQRRPEDAWAALLRVEHGAFSGELSWRQVGERYDRLYGDDGVFTGLGFAPSYDVVRASAAWRITEQTQIYVAADNAFDEEYETTGAFAGAPASFTLGMRLRPQR